MSRYDEMVDASKRGEYGKALRLARQRLGWSQAALGTRVGYGRSEISRFEVGQQEPPDLATVKRLATALGVPPLVLGAARFGLTVDEGDDVRRRQVLMTAGFVLAGVPLGSAASARPSATTTPKTAGDVFCLTHKYRSRVYEQGAGASVRRDITDLLDHTTTLISRAHTSRERRQLLDAMGDAAGLAAYAYRDIGAQAEAQEHYLLAVQAAKAAGDQALVGHLVVRMAGHQIELGNPELVLDHLQAARSVSGAFTPGELSNQCAIAAWAQAQKAATQQVHHAVGGAEDHFAERDTRMAGPDRGWQIRHTAEAELFSLTGAAYNELAKHDPRYAGEAISRLNQALALRGNTFARNATLDTISLAEAYLTAHELDQAVTAAVAAVGQARGSLSPRVRVRLADMSQLLVAHRKRSDVAEVIGMIEKAHNLRTY